MNQGARLETRRLQRGGQQGVPLEAITAAPGVHQLGLDVGDVQPDGPAQQDAQVLEGDVQHVLLMHGAQHIQARRALALIGDAPQIGRLGPTSALPTRDSGRLLPGG